MKNQFVFDQQNHRLLEFDGVIHDRSTNKVLLYVKSIRFPQYGRVSGNQNIYELGANRPRVISLPVDDGVSVDEMVRQVSANWLDLVQLHLLPATLCHDGHRCMMRYDWPYDESFVAPRNTAGIRHLLRTREDILEEYGITQEQFEDLVFDPYHLPIR